MGERLERMAVDGGGYRGDEVSDALVEAVGVRVGGALGARFRLVELRLLWRDWASIRPSMLMDEWWRCDEGGGFLVSLRRCGLPLGRLLFGFWPSMIHLR